MKETIIFLIVAGFVIWIGAAYRGEIENVYDKGTDYVTSSTDKISTSENNTETKTLMKEDIKVGTGVVAEKGKTISVHYTGWLTNGTKFDSSLDRGVPFSFTLGAGEVIKGWDEGVVGMKVGGKRKLTIAPELGYGASAVGPIPANSTLIFEVELLEVK